MKKFPEPHKFTPKNPDKYIGDWNNIIARSNLERKWFVWIDKNPDIIKWNSEEFIIPYYSPVDKKMHRYFVDLVIETKKGEKFAIEIKPMSQTKPPKTGKKQSQTYLNEIITWETNNAKWTAAEKFCTERGMKFIVITEQHLPKSLN